jgi:RHS repeat-associated protein
MTYKSDVGSYTYYYDNKPHAVWAAGGMTFQYDNNGNMTQKVAGGVTTAIQWNYDNKPTSITKGSTTVTFTYDGNGQRVKKVSSLNGTTFYYGELYEVRSGAGIIQVFAGNERVASVFLDGRMQFYHPNHLGSASVVTDQYGERKEQIEYYPFGTYRAVGDPNGTYDYDPNFPDVYYTFTDQEDDDDLGLYNYGARLYDPVLGKFISPDSIVQAPDDPQTLNRYSYARNNPIIYTDPSGNFFDIIIEAIIAIGGCFGITISEGAAAFIFSVTAGAALGAGVSAATGGNIGLGALTGAISGAIFFGAGEVVGSIIGPAGQTSFTALEQIAIRVAVHTVAGAVSGAINSGITGSDIGLGMLTGAVGAGIASGVGGGLSLLKINQFGYQLVGRVVSGAIAGGTASEIYGGKFWQGFAQGAATAAAAFLFNEVAHGPHKNIAYGKATFYEATGDPTATGEFYDATDFTGAMPKHLLPNIPKWGVAVLVEWLDENNKVINSLNVRVNDRMPYHPDRVIDLSTRAFGALTCGQWGLGKIDVRLTW